MADKDDRTFCVPDRPLGGGDVVVCGRSGRGRVLTGDQQPVGDDVDPQFLTLEKMAPRPSSSSSTRKGTTLVSPTSASSPSVKPVTFLPSTSGFRAADFTWRRTPGA